MGIRLGSDYRSPGDGFDRGTAAAQISHCQTVGWPLSAGRRREESPGSTEVRCRVTPGGGDPRESATESTPPAYLGRARWAVRVKRCGKSAPRRQQWRRQGKPHREQDQVGAAGFRSDPECRASLRAPSLGSVARGVRQRAPQRNGHHRPPNQGGGTEPGLHAVWRPIHGGRFSGSIRDKCSFRGTTVWIGDSMVVCRN